MSINPLNELKNGNIEFLYHFTDMDYNITIANIRTASNRSEIVKGFLKKLINDMPSFCFDIIYDMDEYKDIALKLIDKIEITYVKFSNIIDYTCYADEFIKKYLNTYLNSEDKYIIKLTKYALDNKKDYLIKILSRNTNLHVRYVFMKELISNYSLLIDKVYDDISKYMSSVTYEEYEQLTFLPSLMNVEEVSDLAVLLLQVGKKKEYEKVKKYILKEYKYNYLASMLLKRGFDKKFKNDSKILFKTSIDYRLNIYLNYTELVSKKLLKDFSSRIKRLLKDEEYYEIDNIYNNCLGFLLEEYIDKYLELSNSKECLFLGSGTTCSCYRIGDYVLKLIRSKWSYEDIICPNLFLVAKNYEENYVRDRRGIVIAGLEVQKYLSRSANNIDSKYFDLFNEELDRLGYRHNDTLVNGSCGDNAMLLDSYLDADTNNPEGLPSWFKEVPLVLVDRDRVYNKNRKSIKQLSNKY